jgi:N-carbamoyl-L-amino-acid hydrolase
MRGLIMDKLWVIEVIEKINSFGLGEQGVTRLAFDQAEKEAKKYLVQLMEQTGLAVCSDAFGNIIGRWEGKDRAAPAVATGSHVDTVPEGGRYDGVVGVVGGLAAIKELQKQGPLTYPLELIIFAAEESSRFGYSTMGSKAMIGSANVAAWSKAQDHAGILLTNALAQQGIELSCIKQAIRKKEELKAFIELHIEQGRVLEQMGRQIGIVETIAAPTRLKVVVEGRAAHSGTTLMEERQDALISAAMIILAVQEIAMEHSHRGTVGTVSVLKVFPNAINVIPGKVELGIDIRGVDQESIIETLQAVKDAISDIADGQETSASIDVLSSDKPVQLNCQVVGVIEAACHKLNYSCHKMSSRAGHDAMNMAQLTATGMIFIPCQEGISHNPDEYADPEDIMQGIAVLTETLRELAQ